MYEIASPSSSPVSAIFRANSMQGSRVKRRAQAITFDGHNSNVTSVSFHSEGKWLVTGSEDGTIKIWDLRYVPFG